MYIIYWMVDHEHYRAEVSLEYGWQGLMIYPNESVWIVPGTLED